MRWEKTSEGSDWNARRAFREEDENSFWFKDHLHNPVPLSPIGASIYIDCLSWGYQVAAQELSIPTTKGYDMSVYRGWLYQGPKTLSNEEEIKRREVVFKRKIAYVLKNWEQYYGKAVNEWLKNIKYLNAFDLEKTSFSALLNHLEKVLRIQKRHWELHFLIMYPVQIFYLLLEQLCRKYEIGEKEFTKFLQGFENKMLETDRRLWTLARRIKQFGLTDMFIREDRMEELPTKLRQNDMGKRWLEEFNGFLQIYGNRIGAGILDYNYPTWRENPEPVLETLKTYLLKGDFDFEENKKALVEEREQAIENALMKIPTEEERKKFKRALEAAQKTYPANEDHNFYVEQGTFAAVRRVLLECGKRLSERGIIERADDIFFLTIDELKVAVEDLAYNEGIAIFFHRLRLPQLVEERRRLWKKLCEIDTPLFLGKSSKEFKHPPTVEFLGFRVVMNDPITMKVFGIIPELLRREEEKEVEKVENRLEGYIGSAGVVEGPARVILSYKEFGSIMPGDILVCVSTTPAWTPIFSKIKAIVTDTGGLTSHTAIAAQEYRIPAVVGTWKATKVIKNGQRIRVDGTTGVVKLLKAR